jgi:hypothetical protein
VKRSDSTNQEDENCSSRDKEQEAAQLASSNEKESTQLVGSKEQEITSVAGTQEREQERSSDSNN